MASHADVNTPLLALLGFLGSILVFAIIVLLTVIYYAAEEREEFTKNVNQPYTDRDNLVAAQQARLVEYYWVDQTNRVVAIPIDRAMQLVVAESRADRQAGREAQGGTDSAGTESSASTGEAEESTSRGGQAAGAPADGRRTE